MHSPPHLAYVVLGVEHWALYILGNHSATRSHGTSLFCVCFRKMPHYVVQADLELMIHLFDLLSTCHFATQVCFFKAPLGSALSLVRSSAGLTITD